MYSLSCTSGLSDEPGERVALFQACDPKRQSRYRGRSYGVMEVRIMRRAGDAFRWTYYSKNTKAAFLVDDFVIEADFSLTPDQRSFDNFRAGFETHGGDSRMSADIVEQMHRTLQRAKKAVSVYPRRGGIIEFLDYSRAILKSMGITEHYAHEDETERGDLDVPGNFVHLPHTRALMNHLESVRRLVQS